MAPRSRSRVAKVASRRRGTAGGGAGIIQFVNHWQDYPAAHRLAMRRNAGPLAVGLLCLLSLVHAWSARADPGEPPPDLIVAGDGSGAFRTIQSALDSIPKNGRLRERRVVFIKDGLYREKVRIDPHCVTLRGQSRKGVRIEFEQLNDEFQKSPDKLGRAVININGDDVVLKNLTVSNTARNSSLHAFTVYGRGDRTITLDCDLVSDGNDTCSLWNGEKGRYYHVRCHFQGSVDFLCPRGWCYAVDCSFYEVRNTAALWHDGSRDADQKLVLRRCSFDGAADWVLGRHHHDAQFFLLDCTFSRTMKDQPLGRYVYADAAKDRETAAQIRWGERNYYHNCHREGGDYPWHGDNLGESAQAPKAAEVTAAWTFGGKWDPEGTAPVGIAKVEKDGGEVRVTFGEEVSVRGRPELGGRVGSATFAGGSGTRVLAFRATEGAAGPWELKLRNGDVFASAASVSIRRAAEGPVKAR